MLDSRVLPTPLHEIHTWIRSQPWLGRFTLMNRLLLAMAFIPTGLVKATGQRFTTIPVSNPIGFFFEAMFQTGPFWYFIGLCQIVAGVLLLIPATATVGALLFLPIIFSIVLVTWGLQFTGTVYITSAMLLSVLYLLAWDADRLWAAAGNVVGRREGPGLLVGATLLEKSGWLLGAIAGMALLLTTRDLLPISWRKELLFTGIFAALMVLTGWGMSFMRSVRKPIPK